MRKQKQPKPAKKVGIGDKNLNCPKSRFSAAGAAVDPCLHTLKGNMGKHQANRERKSKGLKLPEEIREQRLKFQQVELFKIELPN